MAATKRGVLLLGLFVLALTGVIAQDDATFTPFERYYFMRVSDNPYDAYTPTTNLYSMSPGDDAPIQETAGGWDHMPILSPDGRYLVYTAYPPLITAALERGEEVYSDYFCCGPYPTEIHLIDLTKPQDDPTRITQITEPLTVNEITTDLSPYHYNSDPVWSPDGTRFAWVESFEDSRLLMYDTRTGEIQTIASSVNAGYGDGSDWSVERMESWGGGIAHTYTRPEIHAVEIDGSWGVMLEIFSETGDASNHVITYLTSQTDEYDYWLTWVEYGGEWRVLIYYTESGFVLFDPLTNIFEVLDDPPVFESILGGGWQGVILPDPAPLNPRLGGQTVEWHVNGAALEHQPPDTLTFTTFDPSGVPLFVTDVTRTLVYWDAENSTITPVLPETDDLWQIGAVEWVPGVWRVTGETTPVEQTCCALWTSPGS